MSTDTLIQTTMTTVSPSAPALLGEVAVGDVAVGEVAVDEIEELLIEEISIDGMCGVY